MRGKGLVLLPLLMTVVLTGCVHHSPFEEDYYFQAMGRDSEIVVTADTTRLKSAMPDLLTTGNGVMDDILDRSTRVSVSFYKDSYGGEEDYPADLSEFDYYGALEGNYGSFTINTALSWSSQFHKEKADGVKYYTDDDHSIELAVPESGLLLFASKDYVQAYLDTVEERLLRIDGETAKLMGESLFGLYVRSPKTMIDLGFELPYSVIAKMSDALIYVNESEDGGYVLNADITMQSADLAGTLTQLLRQQVMGDLRRQGIRPDFAALADSYRAEGSRVIVRGHALTEDQAASLSGRITSITGGVL